MSVVDGKLKLYGVENLRIANGSMMPRVTTGNTTSPCVIIGEPKSRGQVRLKGPNPIDPLQIDANILSHPGDMKR